MKRTLGTINSEIRQLFADNDVVVDGPGIEAFENACEDLAEVNPKAAARMNKLADEWDVAFAKTAPRSYWNK